VAIADSARVDAPEAVVAFTSRTFAPTPAAVTPAIAPLEVPSATADGRDRLDEQLASCVDRTYAMLERLGPDLVPCGLLAILEMTSPETYDHAWRVAASSAALGRAMRLSAADVRELRRAALFHDIGKIAIPSCVLERSGPLSDHEMAILRQHVTIGAELLASVPSLAELAPVVGASHERYSGGGYPTGLSGTDIPLGARIIALADAYDAMTTRRCYGSPLSRADATAELWRCAGTHFDPEVMQAWIQLVACQGDHASATH
jgi:putative nucleotidyltransferase with HDIG domain